MGRDQSSIPCIHILGGGIASLAAAERLTRDNDWWKKYRIVIYQQGWRLGGKAASSRDAQGRILDHGFHALMDFYTRAFDLLERCYQQLPDLGYTPPFPSVEAAFKSVDHIRFRKASPESPAPVANAAKVVADPSSGFMTFRLQDMSVSGIVTNTHVDFTKLDGAGLQALQADHQRRQEDHAREGREAGAHRAHVQKLKDTERGLDADGHELLRVLKPELKNSKELPRDHWMTDPEWNFPDPVDFEPPFSDIIVKAVKGVVNGVRRVAGKEPLDPVREALVELAGAIFLGLANHTIQELIGLRVPDYTRLDQYDFRHFLKEFGGVDVAHNPMVEGSYNITFSSAGQLGAGVAIAGALGLAKATKALYHIPLRGLGEVMITPLYRLLCSRGVRFEFFTAVEALEGNGGVQRLKVRRQAQLLTQYEPLVAAPGGPALTAWPAVPNFRHPLTHAEQLHRGAELAAKPWTFESAAGWQSWDDCRAEIIELKEEDTVVLGISAGAARVIVQPLGCTELDTSFGTLTRGNALVRTFSSQFWHPAPIDEAAPGKGVVVGACAAPYETFVDMSHQREQEPDRSGALTYLCGSAASLSTPAPATPAQVQQQAEAWYSQNLPALWPGAPSASYAHHHFSDHPSDLYVRCPVGTTSARLGATVRSVQNLYLAGDWTKTSLNCGCMESAIESGQTAATAIIARYPRKP